MKKVTLARLLVGFVLAFVTPLVVSAKPALWALKNNHTTIYLFGTVHLLPNDTAWHYAALDKALADSGTLYIELTDDDQAHMTALVLRYGLDTAHPLSTLLTGPEIVKLETAAKNAGVPGGLKALNIMRPWLAALTLSVAPLLKSGLDPEHGVDKLIKVQMNKAGKSVRGLETAEQQIRFLADMPPPMELAFLRSTLRESDQDTTELKRVVDAWKAGNVAAIAKLEDEDLRRREPKLYQRLLVTRNKTWADKIVGLLKQPGTIFIAVGAAHLAGPDSVQQQLKHRGLYAERQP